MNLLFSMSLAGSLVLILYFVTKPATRRFLPASWRYQLLKVSLLFYLIPYQYLKYIYVGIWEYFFPNRPQNADPLKPVSIIRSNKVLLIDSNGGYHFDNQTVILTALGIWGILVITYLFYLIKKYAYCKKDLQQITKLPYDLPNEQGISKRRSNTKVSLFASPYITAPFTLGLLSHRIILPVSLTDGKASQMIIAHEMAHVKNHDNLIKLMWLLVMLLHWYNPAIYLLYWEICKVSEQVCDAIVIQGLSAQEKKQYQLLIIDLSQKKPNMETLFASPFSGRFRMMKERINTMDRATIYSSKKINIVVSLVMAILILILSPISVLAYSPAPTYQFQDEQIGLKEGILYTYPGLNNFQDVYDPFQEYVTEHNIFVTSDGQVYILNDTPPQGERALCFHTWQDGTLSIHEKNDDGSCTVSNYNCQYCTKCNAHKNETLNNKVSFPKCPH